MVTLLLGSLLARRVGFFVVPVIVVCSMLAASRPATATPTFYFQATSGTTMQQEAIGDAGGTSFSLANGWPAGRGLPTQMGGWPTSPFPPGFTADVSFSGSNGISGYHTSNLYLSEPAYVQFEFVGKGNAVYQNQFKVNGSLIYDTTTVSTNGPNPTGVYLFGAGLVPFTYVANVGNQQGTGTFTIPNGSNTANPVDGAAFFLGFDPYTAATTFTTSGTGSVYIGLSDRPENVPDHDFQDLGVKVTIVGVPEPASAVLAALGVSAAGLTLGRRRTRGTDVAGATAALDRLTRR